LPHDAVDLPRTRFLPWGRPSECDIFIKHRQQKQWELRMDDAQEAPPVDDLRGRPIGRVALVWRGGPDAQPPPPTETRFHLIFSALEAAGVCAAPVLYAEGNEEKMRARLLAFNAVLVWVDPFSSGKDRSRLDPLLRDLAAHGIWVSTHPDVTLKMGVKEVLYRTRHIGWGADTDLYVSVDDLRARFPARLATSGPRVLKQNRGNGGQGVWKVEVASDVGRGPTVRVLQAPRGSVPEELSLDAFMTRCESYFAGDGRIVDQAFQPRLPEGMIRCYLAGGEVVGFGHQLIKALVMPPAGGNPEEPGPRIMHPAEAPAFGLLRRQMETEWLPAMQELLDIPTTSLPALWDADFLYGPKTPSGADTYVLCEINVSSVAPYPDSAAPKVASIAAAAARAAAGRLQAPR
jgi:hypothetical protein